ncbi:squalene/phytoene synthase family protein [Streptomyces qinzhouensis]|uniref:Phytoene/squalene synthase family protein n=1 Tax=Streptomyces qinzhouensis TaxID=2599401 RepID=A0A5B8J6F4_9ACTN|nr:squalene/phytoene synthase family protein [Streptomyces qinzhouensis]QDY77385.1 phytoene/squalene synthase family protein [Streptomyces qinzhouensis]
MPLLTDALTELRRHSVTYVDPIMAMPPRLKEAKTAVYLLMRGIDEIEDHPFLDSAAKDQLLTDVACALQTRNTEARLKAAFADHHDFLPPVTLRLADWVALAPADIAPRIVDAFVAMADRMALWARRDWRIRDVDDFDHYVFSVSGVLATLLCDLWAWHDGTRVDRSLMMGYARGIQGANILADLQVDRERGVDFLPDGWTSAELSDYVLVELTLADKMFACLPDPGPARIWCTRPLQIAWAALQESRS